MQKIQITEPSRWISYMQRGLNLQKQIPFLKELASTGADIFVIIYPIFLIWLYLYWICKRDLKSKQWALFIFFSTLISVIINIIIQCFFNRQRPIYSYNTIETIETPLHKFLPSSSFPSDHAVVSMSFAISTLIRWIITKKKRIIRSWFWLIIISLIMTECRILTLVHRPTDILWWLILWAIIPSLFSIKKFRTVILNYLITPTINLEKYIIKKIFKFE